MKRLLFLPIFLLLFIKVDAQNGRWMYLATSIDSATQMIDTLSGDIKQLATYDGHNNIVFIWVKITAAKSAKKESPFDSSVVHIAIDTTTNQMQIKSVTAYKKGNIISSGGIEYPKWNDIIPESVGESYIKYCRALHDKKLMIDLIFNAYLHDPKYPQADNK